MASLASSNQAIDNDDPPPYAPDTKDITGPEDEDDSTPRARDCSVCRDIFSGFELIYCCPKCHEAQNIHINTVNKKKKEPEKHEESKGDKKIDKAAKHDICQSCKDSGELCPNDNHDGGHNLKAYMPREQYYLFTPTRIVMPSDSEIVKCVKTADTEVLMALGKNAKGINARDKDGLAPLHLAIIFDLEDIVRVLVDMGAFVEARTDDGMSPLMVAQNYHYPSMITTLLGLGADPNGKGGTFSPLHKAASIGHEGMILALLAGNPTIDCLYKGMTPLMFAIAMNRSGAARLLLDAGANHSLTTSHAAEFTGLTPFTQAIMYDQTEMALLLIRYGSKIEDKLTFTLPKDMWETPLTLSAIRNSVGVCRVLLDAGANINAQSSNGNTVLTRAAFYGNTDMVKLLLQRKADVEKRTDAKWAALTGAVAQGHLEIVKLLVDHGVVGDPKPYWSWKRFPFNKKKDVSPDTKKKILELVRSVKHLPKPR